MYALNGSGGREKRGREKELGVNERDPFVRRERATSCYARLALREGFMIKLS